MVILDWFKSRKLSADLPAELREASHRLANESVMLRQEVVMAAGGLDRYRRKVEEIREVTKRVAERAGKA